MANAAMRHTFQFYDRLMKSGLTDAQARVIIEAIEDLGDVNLKELATKTDLAACASKADLSALKTELKADISELKADVSELKADVSELKADVSELKADVSELKGDIKEIKANISWLTKLFMGGILAIVVSIVMPFLHHIY